MECKYKILKNNDIVRAGDEFKWASYYVIIRNNDGAIGNTVEEIQKIKGYARTTFRRKSVGKPKSKEYIHGM